MKWSTVPMLQPLFWVRTNDLDFYLGRRKALITQASDRFAVVQSRDNPERPCRRGARSREGELQGPVWSV